MRKGFAKPGSVCVSHVKYVGAKLVGKRFGKAKGLANAEPPMHPKPCESGQLSFSSTCATA